MIDCNHACLMADYNTWVNERLYSLCAGMTDEERRCDRGAFFGSIHGTLNHIMVLDLMFLARFTGDEADMPGFGDDLFETFEMLHQERPLLDSRIRAWAEELTEEWLTRTTTFTSVIDGKNHTLPLWAFVTQMFNHQTHHRGQVTTLLNQMGHDIGSTDIPFMPCFEDALEENDHGQINTATGNKHGSAQVRCGRAWLCHDGRRSRS
ncbi:MAG: damage-inducible protein DinB [Rhodospirillaceae bacterium]|jgi:uncharacterized damage-inducible protein DinB|nr:damage-inducible protein DinB [Rhodospirillaceae bacterium]MBT7615058.1 damage-inducible protein DinB [Rhodospirillaceae bacterium]MBT7645439.1 damage-inducible protein DinB [Rhodospirillaceae bacterium]